MYYTKQAFNYAEFFLLLLHYVNEKQLRKYIGRIVLEQFMLIHYIHFMYLAYNYSCFKNNNF